MQKAAAAAFFYSLQGIANLTLRKENATEFPYSVNS